MKHPIRTRRRQRGVAAVEFALLATVLVFLMAFPIFLGRYFWHYTVVHKAAHDGARYLSTISEAEMREPDLALAADAIAKGIVKEELADLRPGTYAPKVSVICGTATLCHGVEGGALPPTVTVTVEVSMFDTVFRVVPTGTRGLPIKAVVEVPYAGR